MDFIEIHIATRPDMTPIAACPYSLALKHHDFLKQEIKNLLNAGIVHKSMSPWVSPVIVIKKHTTEGSPQQFWLCTPTTGTMKGALALMPLLKIDKLFALLKGAKFFTAFDLWSGYYHIKLDEESIAKTAFMTVFRKFEFLRLPFGLSQGPDFFVCLIYDLLGLDETS